MKPSLGPSTLTLEDVDSQDRRAWNRMPKETSKAYAAFVRYRDQVDRRSYTSVAKELGCSLPNVLRWARKWDWETRAAEFDIHQDDEQRAELARGRSAMRRRHLQIAMAMQNIAVVGLQELQAKVQQKLPLNLSADEVRSLLVSAAKIEHDALGPEREAGRYTEIIVHLGETDDEEYGKEPEPPTIEGEEKLN